MKDKAYTLCYNNLHVFPNVEMANIFFLTCYSSSEGAERERYAKILSDLNFSNEAIDTDEGTIDEFCDYVRVFHITNLKNNGVEILNFPLDKPLSFKDSIMYYNEEVEPLLDKISKINEICGDWDYRGISMDIPHLRSIQVDENKITCRYEKWSVKLDEYVSCYTVPVEDKDLFSKIKSLNIENKEEVLNIIDELEDQFDFKEIENSLNERESKIIYKQNNFEM